MKQNTKIIALALTIAILAILPACKSSTAQSNKKGPSEEAAATKKESEAPKTYELPAEIINSEMKTLDGRTVTLADYRGKVVLLNLWATWCGPCRMEMPELVKISEEMKERGVEVIGLTSVDDRGNTEERVKSFVENQKIPYQIVWATDNVGEEFSSLGNYSIPATFVINRDGHLTAIFTGFNRVRTPQSVRKALENALGSQS